MSPQTNPWRLQENRYFFYFFFGCFLTTRLTDTQFESGPIRQKMISPLSPKGRYSWGGEWERRMLHFEACWVSRIQKALGGGGGSHQVSLWLAGCLCVSSTRLHHDEGAVCSGHIWRPTAASSPLPPFGQRSKQCVPTGVLPPTMK